MTDEYFCHACGYRFEVFVLCIGIENKSVKYCPFCGERYLVLDEE